MAHGKRLLAKDLAGMATVLAAVGFSFFACLSGFFTTIFLLQEQLVTLGPTHWSKLKYNIEYIS